VVAVSEQRTATLPPVPYRGIQPFRYSDHPLFFAREEETRHLLQLVTVYRGVMLYGDSGVGKSSLINAGLLPAAANLGFQPERIRVQPRPGEELVVERIAVADQGGPFLPSLFAPADEDSRPVVLSADEFAARVRSAATSTRPLLVFDQFEELVTLFEASSEQSTQQRIVDMLTALLREELPVKLLFVFREDYLARVKPLLAAAPELVDQALRLRPPAPEALDTIIRGPFERHPGHFERELSPALADKLRAALSERFGSGDVSLSEVQTVCLRLWRADEPEALLEAKGVQGLLEDYLGEELDRFPEDLRYAAGALLSHMVTAQGTRNVISAEDLIGRVQEEEQVPRERLERALDRLESESKLVRRERRRDLYLYEITSEFLVPWITRRRQELIASRESRRLRRRALLLGGIGLSVALVAVGALIGLVWALDQRSDAKRAAAQADARELAAQAVANVDERTDVAALLAVEALGTSSTSSTAEARDAAIATVRRTESLAGLLGEARQQYQLPVFSRNGRYLAAAGADTVVVWDVHKRRRVANLEAGEASAVAIGNNGATVAVSHGEGKFTIWRRDSDGKYAIRPLPRSARGIDPSEIAFSPDGRTMATVDINTSIVLWDLRTLERRRLTRPESEPSFATIAFSQGGRGLTTIDKGGMRLWNVRRGKVVRKADLPVRAAIPSLAPDGRLAAFVPYLSADFGIVLWDVDANLLRARLRLASRVADIAFAADGHRLAVASNDGTIRVWDARRGRLLVGPLQLPGEATGSAFSPDGRTLAVATNGPIALWDFTGEHSLWRHVPVPRSMRQLGGSPDEVLVAASRDGRWIAWSDGLNFGAWDSRRRRWTPLPFESFGVLEGEIVFTERGDAVFSDGGSLYAWDLDGPPEPEPLPIGDASSLALSDDGRVVVTAGATGRIRLLNVESRRPLGRSVRRGRGLRSVAIHPSGRLVAAGGDSELSLWRVAGSGGARRLVPNRPPSLGGKEIRSAVFSPNRRLLAVGDSTGTVRLWSTSSWKQVPPTLFEPRGIANLAFSADSRSIAVAGAGGSIRLWDLRIGRTVARPLSEVGRGPAAAAFAKAGLVTAGADGLTIWEPLLWTGSVAKLRDRLCSVVSRNLSRDEWREFFGDAEYHRSCARWPAA
jgi:WD40 repeat protein